MRARRVGRGAIFAAILAEIARRGASRRRRTCGTNRGVVRILEERHDARDARGRGGDFRGSGAFFLRHDAHQVHDAALSHDLDRVGRELVGLDHPRLDLGRDVRVVGCAPKVGQQTDDHFVVDDAHLLGVLGARCRGRSAPPGRAPRRSAARCRCSWSTFTWMRLPNSCVAWVAILSSIDSSSSCAPALRRSVATMAVVPTAPATITGTQPERVASPMLAKSP